MRRVDTTSSTAAISASASMSIGMSASPAERTMIPRMRRMKCVIGSTSASHCAATGMPAYGNMKPDSRICGRKVKKASCMAWNWLRARVEIRMPSARLAQMNSSEAA